MTWVICKTLRMGESGARKAKNHLSLRRKSFPSQSLGNAGPVLVITSEYQWYRLRVTAVPAALWRRCALRAPSLTGRLGEGCSPVGCGAAQRGVHSSLPKGQINGARGSSQGFGWFAF